MTPKVTERTVRARAAGFTLLELIIVVSIIGILAAIALPNLIQGPTRAKEAVLRTNLHTLRSVIDQYYGDKGVYPPTLEALAEDGYVRDVPIDPFTGEADWQVVYDVGELDEFGESTFEEEEAEPGIIDVFSSSEDLSLDGEPYNEW